MSRVDPSKHFCYRRMWYAPSKCASEQYLVYWGRLVHRDRLKIALWGMVFFLAYAVVTVLLWIYTPYKVTVWEYVINGAIAGFLVAELIVRNLLKAHSLGRRQMAQDHQCYINSLSKPKGFLESYNVGHLVPTRIAG